MERTFNVFEVLKFLLSNGTGEMPRINRGKEQNSITSNQTQNITWLTKLGRFQNSILRLRGFFGLLLKVMICLNKPVR